MSSNHQFSAGLVWRKLDLHVHTPASEDFAEDISGEELVQAALSKGLHAIAITDHNTGDWIDRIKAAAISTSLIVFPGVEITCGGGERNIHLIAIFDPARDRDYVNTFLGQFKFTSDARGRSDTVVLEKSINEVIETIHEWGGVSVLAHANSTSGVLHDIKGQQRIGIVRHPRLWAAEASRGDFLSEDKKKRHKRVVDLLDGTDPDFQKKLAVYQASDNPCPDGKSGHCLEGIGGEYSYFKMEQINLESLQQCLSDPDVRIRQDFQTPESKTCAWIKQISISSGFLSNQTVIFHDGLNSILGGKGSGKSLLVELVRFGLNQPPEHDSIQADHESKLQQRLGEHGYADITFLDQEGIERTARRIFNAYGNSYYDDSVDYDPAQLMPILFLSQNEIIRIAEDEAQQLAFIDRFFDFRTYIAEIGRIEAELHALDRKMAAGLKAYPFVVQLREKVVVLDQEIQRLDAALAHPLFDKYREYERKNRALQQQASYVNGLSERLQSIVEIASASEVPEVPEDLRNDPELKRNLDIIHRATNAIEQHMASLSTAIALHGKEINHELEGWRPDYERVKAEYETHTQQAGGNKQSLALERDRKTQAKREYETQLAEEERKKNSVSEISQSRDSLLQNLNSVYQDYTQQRKEKCKQFEHDSDNRLKLDILEANNREEFRQELLRLREGTYLREVDVEELCSNVLPADFIIAILRYAISIQNRNDKLKDIAKKSKVSLEKLVKLADHLLDKVDYEDLLALQYKVVPQDRPQILYDVGNHNYRPLNSISVGQKSIALLIMALSDGDMPVVIDQPEDSLDIRSIWDDICKKLRSGKETRQFIFTTHNASVAVASDSDYFIILEGSATRGEVVYAGSMDHEPVSEQVLTYLEGGEETYRRKYRKYRGELRFGT